MAEREDAYSYDRVNPSESHGGDHENLLQLREQAQAAMPVADNDQEEVAPPTKGAWIALFLLLLISISNQWQRFLIGYANSLCTKKNENDPNISICAAYPDQFTPNYGFLSGAAFLISFACFGIFGGALADAMSRKVVICASIILWSLTSVFFGLIDNFIVLYIMRFLLGVFQAFLNPAAYSIISDFFHPKYRTTANAVFGVGIYLGGGLSSISGAMLNTLGWRQTYEIVGAIGVGIGFVGFFLIFEPKRNRFDKKKAEQADGALQTSDVDQETVISKFLAALKEMVINPTCRWTTIGASFRFFGGYAIAFFMQNYFTKGVFGTDDSVTNIYFYGNAIVVSLCGFLSSIIYARFSERLEEQGNYFGKALVCILCSVLGIPFFLACTCIQFNIYFSLSMLALEYLVAEGWVPPAITMVVNSIDPKYKAQGTGAFLFFATMAGVISTALLNWINQVYDCKNHPERYGYFMAGFVVFSYAGSIPFFALAGKEYRELMVRRNAAQTDM